MGKSYKPITSMKEVPEQLRKLRRQYLRYQQAEIIYSISHKKLFELASDAGAIYRIDGTVLINRDIFDDYLERFHEPATGNDKGFTGDTGSYLSRSTGMGLYLVQKMATDLSITVELKNNSCGGTTVTLTFPKVERPFGR